MTGDQQDSWRERALADLSDYLYELETGERRKGHVYGRQRSLPPSQRPPPKPPPPPTRVQLAAEAAALTWENRRLRAWRKAGRITADGVLRVNPRPAKPYTLRDVRRIWPDLGAFDQLAVLVDLDGVVRRGFMASKEHENIRKVVEQIADERVGRKLQESDTALLLRDLIRAEVAVIFGEVLAQADRPPSRLKVGGRQLRCSNCRELGHRATTCKQPKKEPAAPPAE